MRVVLAGGSGSLGRRLADDFTRRGADVVILTRAHRDDVDHRQIIWNGQTVGSWADELNDAVVINLAGALVDRRATRRNIELLKASRVDPTRALAEAAARLDAPVCLWLQMSTLAIYGDAGHDVVDERHAPADGPPQMAGVARAWESAADGVNAARVVVMRTGIVLDTNTPAFDRLTRITRRGLGGQISHGDQWISWIHRDDFMRAVQFIRADETLHGVVHVAAPNPVQNREMMARLRSGLHRPWSPPTPKPLVHLGAWFMRTDPALALTGRRCVPARLLERGFEFRTPTFAEALTDLLGQESPRRELVAL